MNWPAKRPASVLRTVNSPIFHRHSRPRSAGRRPRPNWRGCAGSAGTKFDTRACRHTAGKAAEDYGKYEHF
jgi:hypothetical protein